MDNWCNTSRDLFVCTMKRQEGEEEKLKRRAKLAGNLTSKLYPQPFTPPSLLTGIQTTFVASLSLVHFNLVRCRVFCVFWGCCCVSLLLLLLVQQNTIGQCECCTVTCMFTHRAEYVSCWGKKSML